MELSELPGVGDDSPPFPYYGRLSRVTGSTKSALLLSYLIACTWEAGENGWFSKSRVQMEKETGLTPHERRHALRKLREAGIVEERRLEGLLGRRRYRVNLAVPRERWHSTATQESGHCV